MKSLLILLLIVGAFSMKLNKINHEEALVGGYSKIDTNNLTSDQKEIDQYLRSTFPQLNNMELVSA